MIRKYLARSRAERREHPERGDSLIELLIALVCFITISVAAFAGFTTLISSSSTLKGLATVETALKSADTVASEQLGQLPGALYATCATVSQYQTDGTNAVNFATSAIPVGFTAEVTGVQYWNGSGFVSTCQTPETTPGPQLVTVTVSNSATGRSESNQIVVDNAYAPPSFPPDYLAKSLVFTQQPTDSTQNLPITPAIAVAVEDASGAALPDDYSTMTLAISAGTGTTGATLSSTCVGVELAGVFTFPDCMIDSTGTGYTLTATDGSLSVVSQPFSILGGATVPGAPTDVTATQANKAGIITWTPPVDNGGLPITGYTVTAVDVTTYTYLCDSGDTLSGSTCVNTTTYAATIKATGSTPAYSYSCPSGGTLEGEACVTTTEHAASSSTQYSCPSGGTVSGATCTEETNEGPMSGSACSDNGGSLVGGDCIVTSTYAATGTTVYSCGGYGSLDGSLCVVTTSYGALATQIGYYNCNAGDTLAEPTCTHVVTYAGTPSDPNGGEVCISATTTCTETGLTIGDTYDFTATATNDVGTGPASAVSNSVVTVTVPGAPTAVSAVAGNQQATLTWTAPSSNGGSAITNYTATATDTTTPGNGGETCDTTTTTCVVTGLTGGEVYTFTVAATNIAGTGPSSASSNSVTIYGPPHAPTGLTDMSTGLTTASVGWTTPTNTGGSPVTNYTATSNGGQSCTATSAPATIAVGTNPDGLVMNAAGTYEYVADAGSNTVSVINLATNTVTATVAVGNEPEAIAINPQQTFAYVLNLNAKSISVINLATNTVTTTITVGTEPISIATNPAGTYAYVTNEGSNTVSVINLATNTVTATVAVGSEPERIVVNPAGTFAFVSNYGGASVTIINTSLDTVVDTVALGSQPYAMVVNPQGTELYVADYGGVSVVNIATNLVTTVTGLSQSSALALNPQGTELYVAEPGSYSLSTVSTATNTLTATTVVGLGTEVNSVTVNASGTYAYLTTLTGLQTLAVVNLATQAVTTVAAVPASFVSLNPSGTYAYLSGASSGTTVDVVNLTTDALGGIAPSCVVTGLSSGTSYTFSATATNTYGTGLASASAPSLIAGTPGPPTGVFATTGDENAAVTWLTPTVNESIVTDYTVIATDTTNAANGGESCTAATLACTVNGLTVGDTYTFSVTATDAYGTGPVSLASPPYAATGPPGPPTGVTTTFDGTTGFISWTPPANDGGLPVTSYTVTATDTTTSANGGQTTTVTMAPPSIAVGTNPEAVAVNPAGTFAYVANEKAGTMSVINLATNTVTNTVTLGGDPDDIVLNAAGTLAYVTLYTPGALATINLSTFAITTVSTGATATYPTEIVLNPSGTVAYVLCGGDDAEDVQAINLTTNTVAATYSPGLFQDPTSMIFNPTFTTLFMTVSGDHFIAEENMSTKVVTDITIGTTPSGSTVNQAGTFAYVTNEVLSGTVSVLNLATNTVTATIAVGSDPTSIVINPTGTFAYVNNYGSNTFSVINLATDTVTATIAVGTNPEDLVINPAGTFAYVANYGSASVSVINLATNTVTATIAVGTNPEDLVINPAGTFAYVANYGSATVSPIDLATNTAGGLAATAQVNGLTPGDTYTFVVTATNADGTSVPSEPSEPAVTP